MKKSTVRLLARSNRPVCIARTSTNSGHVLAVCVAAHGEVLTFKTTRDGQSVRALSVAFEGRKPVSNSTVVAGSMITALTWARRSTGSRRLSC